MFMEKTLRNVFKWRTYHPHNCIAVFLASISSECLFLPVKLSVVSEEKNKNEIIQHIFFGLGFQKTSNLIQNSVEEF